MLTLSRLLEKPASLNMALFPLGLHFVAVVILFVGCRGGQHSQVSGCEEEEEEEKE